MAEDLHPEVEHDPLPHHLHRVGLEILEDERRHQDDEKDEGDPVEPGGVGDGDVVVDRQLDEIRLRQLHQRMSDDGRQGDDDGPPVRTEIAQ